MVARSSGMLRVWSVAMLSMCLGALMVPLLVWQIRRPAPAVAVAPRAPEVATATVEPPPTGPVQVVDVAHGLSAMDVPTLLHLAPGEHIGQVDGVAVVDEYAAWRAIVTGASDGSFYSARTRAGRFVDLEIDDDVGGVRRVLLLLH